ncbi:MAG: [ribosomal protein S5]-alanine N-acetyltransferase [Candidatus Dependentiae bacterium]|nr:[ribosomal protein S5]-alanine N-acetyltransferase [Candidatus Dependentiae bacterium]
MNKHFATIVVAANCALIIGFLSIDGLLPPAPETIEEIIEERKVDAYRCRNCTNAVDLSPGAEKLDEKIDDNAKNVKFIITSINPNPEEGTVIWFETDRLLFRTIKMSDVDDMYAYAHKPEVAARHTWAAHKSKAETIDLIRNWLDRYQRKLITPWGIEEKATGRFIGTAGITQYNDVEPRCVFSYAIGDSAWGKGYELETARAWVEFSLILMGSKRTAALARCDDRAAQEVLEQAGLSREGIEPDFKCINGKFISLYHYSLLRKEVNSKLFSNSKAKL